MEIVLREKAGRTRVSSNKGGEVWQFKKEFPKEQTRNKVQALTLFVTGFRPKGKDGVLEDRYVIGDAWVETDRQDYLKAHGWNAKGYVAPHTGRRRGRRRRMSLRDDLLAIARRRAAGDDEGALAALDALGAEHPDDPVRAARARAGDLRPRVPRRRGRRLRPAGRDRPAPKPRSSVPRPTRGCTPSSPSRVSGARPTPPARRPTTAARSRSSPTSRTRCSAPAALHGNPSADVSADEATAWRQRAARLQPENMDNWLQLARLHDAADRPEQAERARARAALAPARRAGHRRAGVARLAQRVSRAGPARSAARPRSASPASR